MVECSFPAHLRYGFDHLSRDIAGADRVHGDAALRALLGERLGEPDLARLRGGIVCLAKLSFLAVDRRDVDDAPKFARPHSLDHRTAHVEKRAQIGVDHRCPLLRGHPVEHGVPRVTPALLTNTSMGPSSASTALIPAAHES